MLGQAEYQVNLQARGGQPIDLLPFSAISYERKLDDVTECRLELGVLRPGTPRAKLAASLTDWQHEVGVFRDGESVWEGPLITPTWRTDYTTGVLARDLFAWFDRRWLPVSHEFVDVDLGLIFHTLALDAYNQEPSPNFSIQQAVVGVAGTRSVDALMLTPAGDTLRELARIGIDFCTIGRHVRVGGGQIAAPMLPTITTETLLDATLNPDGLSTATQAGVVGATTGSGAHEPATAVYGSASPVRGLLQRSFHEPDVVDYISATTAARTRWDMLQKAPQYLSGRLSPRYPVEMDRLVPGALVPVEATIGVKDIGETMRLATVKVDVNSDGQETVNVTFIPVGSEDLS